ncbi:MAG: ABC transporter permease [Dehalococcoidia bacterium]
MTTYIIRRLLLFVPTLVLVTAMVFATLRIMPGDVAALIVTGGGESGFNERAYQEVQRELHLDESIAVQYLRWVGAALQGDFGNSYWSDTSVRDELVTRLPVTLELAIAAPLLGLLLGVPLGIISAVRQNTAVDYAARTVSLTGLAIPNFWLGILIIIVLANVFGWVVPLRYAELWQDPWTNLRQLFWPILVLATGFMALLSRVTRSAMLEVLRADYIRTARSKGLRGSVVVRRHGLRNALLPIVTITAAQFGGLISGTLVTEQIFNVPGMGRYFVESVFVHDFPVIQAVVLLIGVAYLTINLLVDLAYAWLDPRIHFA